MLGFDDAGDLYVTYPAFGMGTAEGEGAMIAIDLDAVPVSLADLGNLGPSCDAVSTPQASPVAGSVEVTIDDFAFAPNVLEVPAGTTVTWTNEESVPHTVETEDGVIDSGMLNEGDSFSFTFDEPGTYDYICGYHPRMTATIVVV
jgi:plastocyanin